MNETQFRRLLCLSAILMMAFAATASADDGWVISDQLSTVLPSGAKSNLDLETIDEAIQYGKRFDSRRSLFQQLAKLESDVDLGVDPDCVVSAADPLVNWEDLCQVISQFHGAREANAMWVFSFLPQGNWNSKIEVVWGESP